jgi:hypothetical protein
VTLRPFSSHPSYHGGVLPQQLHYLADWIVYIALRHELVLTSISKGTTELSTFFKTGFFSDFRGTSADAVALDAQRAWYSNNRVRAVLDASKALNMNPRRLSGGVPCAVDWMRSTIPNWCDSLTRDELGVLFNATAV